MSTSRAAKCWRHRPAIAQWARARPDGVELPVRAGTDRLTPGGMEHLGFLARRRPVPTQCYVQTAQDVTYDRKPLTGSPRPAPNLDQPARWQAVQNYLMAQTAGRT